MKRCPWCAEEIQDEARICRFCGRPAIAAPPPLLEQPGRYDVPFRIERQLFGAGGAAPGGLGYSSSSAGIAVKGSVCPGCRSPDYTQVFSVWHGVLAILAFPIGLLALAFPIKQCSGCGTRYGAGVELTRVVGIIVIAVAVLLLAIILAISAEV